MTTVALYRGPEGTGNALVVDAVANTKREPREQWWEEKLRRMPDGSYVTAIGDSLLLDAIMRVTDFLDPEVPNLSDLGTIADVLHTIDCQLAINQVGLNHHPEPHSLGAFLFACSRAEAFLWMTEFEVEKKRFKLPTQIYALEPGDLVLCSGIRTWMVRGCTGAPTFDALVGELRKFDTALRTIGMITIEYELDDYFSGVVLPHNEDAAVTRMRPFGSIWELMVRKCGPEGLAVLTEPKPAE